MNIMCAFPTHDKLGFSLRGRERKEHHLRSKKDTPKVFGYLHNSDNSCTGLSLRSQFLSTLKLPLGNKIPRGSNSFRVHSLLLLL